MELKAGDRIRFIYDTRQEVFQVEAVSAYERMFRLDGVWYWMYSIVKVEDV